ncbi:mucin-5AC-like [Lytechinus variegatus]|uniref:mucin-5AC-like n=1 Tax=Lytechinus variegatus TaxID=7654 RepID=UPI001BB2B77E|nr:mucin-5AC-like [Lytechinus variegatus]XP_041484880.1 mucin-5AC-like [Lytechinus variegatus]XP_041484881.1 mucin-5AC-like [Lytechinus variegatus]
MFSCRIARRVAVLVLIVSYSSLDVAATTTNDMPTNGTNTSPSTMETTVDTTETMSPSPTSGVEFSSTDSSTASTQIMATSNTTDAGSSTTYNTMDATTADTTATTDSGSSTTDGAMNATTPTSTTDAEFTATDNATDSVTTDSGSSTTDGTMNATSPTMTTVDMNATTMAPLTTESDTGSPTATSELVSTMMNSTTPVGTTENATTTDPESTTMSNTTENVTSSTMDFTADNTSSSTISSTTMSNMSDNATTYMASTMSLPNTTIDTETTSMMISTEGPTITNGLETVSTTEPITNSSEPPGDPLSLGAIIGISVGGAVLLLILLIAIICVCCKGPAKDQTPTFKEVHSETSASIPLGHLNDGVDSPGNGDIGIDRPASIEFTDELNQEKEKKSLEKERPKSGTTTDDSAPIDKNKDEIGKQEHAKEEHKDELGTANAKKDPDQKDETINALSSEPTRLDPSGPVTSHTPQGDTAPTCRSSDSSLEPTPRSTTKSVPEKDLTPNDQAKKAADHVDGNQEQMADQKDLPVPAKRISLECKQTEQADTQDPKQGDDAKSKPKPKPKPKPEPITVPDRNSTSEKGDEGDVDKEDEQGTSSSNDAPVPAYRPAVSPRKKNVLPPQNSAAGLLANILKPKSP